MGFTTTTDTLIFDDLLEKYSLLFELRLERESLENEGTYRLEGEAAEARRFKMQNAANKYPGSLRELESRNVSNLRKLLEFLIEGEKEGLYPEDCRLWGYQVWWFHMVLKLVKCWRRLNREGRCGQAMRVESYVRVVALQTIEIQYLLECLEAYSSDSRVRIFSAVELAMELAGRVLEVKAETIGAALQGLPNSLREESS